MQQSQPSRSRDQIPAPRDAGRKPAQAAQPQASSDARMDPQPDYGLTSYRGQGRLTDRIAVVNGADGGIGRAVALAFAREGADVVIGYLENEADAAETADAVQAAGRQAITIAADLGRDEHAWEFVARAVSQFGRIDILVNHAARQGGAVELWEPLDPERVEAAFRTNILSMFQLVRYALLHMGEGSSIINVAPAQAHAPSPAILECATAKGAIVTFTKGLARSLIRRGIRVNCVAPGPIWTPRPLPAFDAEKRASFRESSALGAQPAELAPAFVFLASDESRSVNGAVLGITSGQPLA
jgi:NAD(P)-dependent dehydrogenase (short-subunit alcohol dehydrogenase family)